MLNTSKIDISKLDVSKYDTWIFDLDNTLYRADVDFFSQIDRKMTSFIADYLKTTPVKAREIQKQYLVDYGTSLSGLMAVHDMDPVAFMEYVHDVDLSLLTPDPLLRTAISALPGRKLIYTNGSRGHAKNVGEHLGLYDLFDGSFGVEDAGYIPKPKRASYDVFCTQFNITSPERAIMFEDSVRNLEVPKDMGMTTVLVTSDADWSHEPVATRPVATLPDANHSTGHTGFIDHSTHNLTQWLTKALSARK